MYSVAVIGGGPVGLATSILLSLHNIDHVLFEKHPSTSVHPKACGLNQRTIEIFRRMGIEREFLSACAPPNIAGRTAWYTSFGPEGKEIVSRDAWGGGQYAAKYKDASPCPYVVMPQIRFEPILQRRALELSPGCLKFNTEVLDLQEFEDHTELTVRPYRGIDGGDTTIVHARYCIVADGGRDFTQKLGIEWEGERDLVAMIAVHFRAAITKHMQDSRNFITWFVNPALGGSIGTGYIYHLGPYPTAPEAEEWLFACALNPEDPRKFDKEHALQRLQKTLQIPDLRIEVLSFSHWHINAIAAERYRSRPADGRIFLVGDAAHRIPPYGGLGLNTGVQDANNLVWKLAYALNSSNHSSTTSGVSPDFGKLLDSYGTERKPVAERVARSGLHNVRSHGAVIDKTIGILPGQTKDENVKAVHQFLNSTDEEVTRANKEALGRAQEILDCEFNALGAEVGWFYPSLDKACEGSKTYHDGQLNAQTGEFDILDYHPSTIPGHHIPHAWLSSSPSRTPNGLMQGRGGDANRVSTLDLLETGCLLFISHVPGLWEDILDRASSIYRVSSHVIVPSNPSATGAAKTSQHSAKTLWYDVDGTWAKVRGVSETGAVLVRPDGIVVWRAQDDSVLGRFQYGLQSGGNDQGLQNHSNGSLNGNGHKDNFDPAVWFLGVVRDALMLN